MFVLIHFCCNSVECVAFGNACKKCSVSPLTTPSCIPGVCACCSLPSQTIPSLVPSPSVTRSRDGAGLVHRRKPHSFTTHSWPKETLGALAHGVSDQSPTKGKVCEINLVTWSEPPDKPNVRLSIGFKVNITYHWA